MKILVVDDEKNICLTMQGIMEDEGYHCDFCLNFKDGFALLSKENYDLVFLDIWLPDKDGTDGLRDIRRTRPDVDIVMITGHGNIENAIDSIRFGAYDFLEKPLSLDRILTIVKHLSEKRQLQQALNESNFNLIKKYDLIGSSQQIMNLRKKIEKIAQTDTWVLVKGENGTGKEHVARLIYMLSKRANAPFIEINCSAVPSELIESEMFGHEKGAFTGAVARKPGKIELADGGTLFLDEIGDMGLSMQAKLLRVLESGTFNRVGSNELVSSNFRLISATNKNLDMEVSTGSFRQDLFYRINVLPIEVPPLRARRNDIPALATHFLQEVCIAYNFPHKQISPTLMTALMKFDWPGNIRQLRNVIEQMAALSETGILSEADLPDYLTKGSSEIGEISAYTGASLKDARDEFEKQYIINALNSTGWNITKASRLLDIERTYLHKKIKLYNLERQKDS
jgi:two-component system nitrogen regulation response regulator NtrX